MGKQAGWMKKSAGNYGKYMEKIDFLTNRAKDTGLQESQKAGLDQDYPYYYGNIVGTLQAALSIVLDSVEDALSGHESNAKIIDELGATDLIKRVAELSRQNKSQSGEINENNNI